VKDKKITIGELTAVDGTRVYTVFLALPSKAKARDTVKKAIDRNHRHPG
jgi:hypothetical protein